NNHNHHYLIGLIKSFLTIENKKRRRLHSIKGNVPSPGDIMQGCPFEPRCKFVMDICQKKMPRLEELSPGHSSRCWLHQEDKNNRGVNNHEKALGQNK